MPNSRHHEPGTALRVFIGTYTSQDGGGEGIYACRLDLATGALAELDLVARTRDPSFLALHPRGHHLYAANEVDSHDGTPGGTVSAYAIDPATGGLEPLGSRPSRGAGPCFVSVDRAGRFVLVANYGGDSVAALPIGPSGRLGPGAGFARHEGSGSDPERQDGPHPHAALPDPDNRFVLVPDLGTDRVVGYEWDPGTGQLTSAPGAGATLPAGAGPRHLAFHPNGRYAYVVSELGSAVTSFQYDRVRGALTAPHALPAAPPGFRGENLPAEIAVHPSGRFVYASNRGHDSIAVFRVDPATGQLTSLGHAPTLGRSPRHFALDPTGGYLLAANQASGNVVSFRIDQRTGGPQPTGHEIAVPAPACVTVCARS